MLQIHALLRLLQVATLASAYTLPSFWTHFYLSNNSSNCSCNRNSNYGNSNSNMKEAPSLRRCWSLPIIPLLVLLVMGSSSIQKMPTSQAFLSNTATQRAETARSAPFTTVYATQKPTTSSFSILPEDAVETTTATNSDETISIPKDEVLSNTTKTNTEPTIASDTAKTKNSVKDTITYIATAVAARTRNDKFTKPLPVLLRKIPLLLLLLLLPLLLLLQGNQRNCKSGVIAEEYKIYRRIFKPIVFFC